jgi:hypothetical protein
VILTSGGHNPQSGRLSVDGLYIFSYFRWCTEKRLTSDGAERGPSRKAWAEAKSLLAGTRGFSLQIISVEAVWIIATVYIYIL